MPEWQAAMGTSPEAAAATRLIHELRETARNHTRTPKLRGGVAVSAASKSFPGGTSVGRDLWGAREFAWCSPEDLDELSDIIADVEDTCTPLGQTCINIMNLLGKALGVTAASAQ